MTDAIDDRKETIEARRKELEALRNWKDQLKRDRTTLLKQPEFQRVMSDIIAKGGMFQSVMTGNSMTYHKAGRQDFAREIWADFAEVDIEAAHELLKPRNGDFRNA